MLMSFDSRQFARALMVGFLVALLGGCTTFSKDVVSTRLRRQQAPAWISSPAGSRARRTPRKRVQL